MTLSLQRFDRGLLSLGLLFLHLHRLLPFRRGGQGPLAHTQENRLAVGAERLYWSKRRPLHPKGDALLTAERDGSEARQIVDHQDSILKILPRGKKVFWLTRGSIEGRFEDGLVMVFEDGAPPRLLLGSLNAPRGMAFDGDLFLILGSDWLFKVGEDGRAISREGEGWLADGATIAADRGGIYIGTSNLLEGTGGILKLPRDLFCRSPFSSGNDLRSSRVERAHQ